MLSKDWDSREEGVRLLAGLLIELPDKAFKCDSSLC